MGYVFGLVVGGPVSSAGAIFGAAFIQLVPNVADELSNSSPWAIYRVQLIGLMARMHNCLMGLARPW